MSVERLEGRVQKEHAVRLAELANLGLVASLVYKVNLDMTGDLVLVVNPVNVAPSAQSVSTDDLVNGG